MKTCMIVTLSNVTFTDDVGVYFHKRRHEVRVRSYHFHYIYQSEHQLLLSYPAIHSAKSPVSEH